MASYGPSKFPAAPSTLQSSTYSTSKLTGFKSELTAGRKGIPIWQWWTVLVCIVVVMLTLIASIGISLLRREEDGEDGEQHDDQLSLPGTGGGSSSNPVIYVRVTAASTQTPDPRKTTHTVCTTRNCRERRLLPEDGLCDFVFCDSLRIKHGTNEFGVQVQNEAARQPFFDYAMGATKTRYGMSIDIRTTEKLSSALATPKGIEDYESYWSVNIADWGFLNINEFDAETHSREFVDALTILKTMNEHRASKSREPTYTFLGLYFKTNLCEMLARQIRATFTPTGIVVLGHISYLDRNRSDCIIMPPTNFKDPRVYNPSVGYGHTMNDAVDAVRCLRNHGVRTTYSVSVTMQGRWYSIRKAEKVPAGQGQRYFYQNCTVNAPYEQEGSAQEMCDDPGSAYGRNIAYDDNNKALITYDDIYGYALTFDNRNTLKFKICNAWKNVTFIRCRVAVYDINYDANTTQCDERWIRGSWERLRFLGRLQTFIQENYKKPEDYDSCLQVT